MLAHLTGCVPEPPLVPPELRPGTFAGEIPKELETQLLFDTQTRTLRVDASQLRIFFPMPRTTRSFQTEDDFFLFAQSSLGAETVRDQQGRIVGIRGRQTQVGNSFFYDPQLDLAYLVENELDASAVCGYGSVEDSRLEGGFVEHRTGGGPNNRAICGE